jgi:hypothetical protein
MSVQLESFFHVLIKETIRSMRCVELVTQKWPTQSVVAGLFMRLQRHYLFRIMRNISCGITACSDYS